MGDVRFEFYGEWLDCGNGLCVDMWIVIEGLKRMLGFWSGFIL